MHFFKTYLLTLYLVALSLIIQGCATPETRIIEKQGISQRLPFIRDGVVTRSEIIGRLGTPATLYEDGRIITYWLIENDDGKFEVIPKKYKAISLRGWSNRRNQPATGYHNLVLVFGDDDVLERHSLVFIR